MKISPLNKIIQLEAKPWFYTRSGSSSTGLVQLVSNRSVVLPGLFKNLSDLKSNLRDSITTASSRKPLPGGRCICNRR